MAEVVMLYKDIAAPDGTVYLPRACGRIAEDGLWEGWIEFVPGDGGQALRTPRETDQPNWDDLIYWATGLTPVYLEGALARALRPAAPHAPVEVSAAYDGPARDATAPATATARAEPRAVLDPFKVYAQGESILRQELTAIEAPRLRDIIAAHTLLDTSALDLESMSRATLAELIVAAVRKRTQADLAGG